MNIPSQSFTYNNAIYLKEDFPQYSNPKIWNIGPISELYTIRKHIEYYSRKIILVSKWVGEKKNN